MPTVAVVGAGVVGASIAFRLAKGGASVIIVDRGQPGSGTTSASFAWANANQKTPSDYFDLNYAGLKEHYRLADKFGDAPWLHTGGNLIWADDPDGLDELQRRVKRLRDWGYIAEFKTTAQVNAELEPVLTFPASELPVAYFREEAWVDAPRLVKTLLDAAQRHGADLRPESQVAAIETNGGRVSHIQLQTGEPVQVDAVVNAAGPSADRVAALLDLPLPLAPTRGLLVRVAATDELLRRVIHSPGVNIRPDGPGHFLLHHDSIDERLGERAQIAPDDPLCVELRDRAATVLPPLGGATITGARIGIRPIPHDGRSCVGAVSAVPGYFEAVTHSGVTLGPLLGRVVAAEILAGEIDPLIVPFRPDRFPRVA